MIKTKKIYMASILALSLALAACSNDSADQKAQTESASPATSQTAQSAPHSMPTGGSMAESTLTGTVVETFNSGGYTYIQLDNGTDKIWAAINQAEVKQGEEISLNSGPVMHDFHSPSLNRTFAEIVFSSGIKGAAMTNPHGSMAAAPAANTGSAEDNFMAALTSGSSAPAPAMDAAASTGGSMKAIVSAQEIKVAKAEGDSGRTVEEVYAQADSLNGQKVKVRGKVVKFSPQIMGTNWLHIQDGTGNPMQNSHDLVVTTDGTVEEGAVVVVEGTVAAKKDFGMGYFYEALVEKAEISK